MTIEVGVTDYKNQVTALNRSQAVIEFELDGTIITANNNFLAVVGYTLEEIRGKHHRIFVDPEISSSDRYRAFWMSFAAGRFHSGEFQRFGKNNKEFWIQASYNPILDENGRPYKVVKFATDITDQKLRGADHEGQLAAISRSQATIEFELDGTIIKANENFLAVVGYTLEEIRGKHHRMFADPGFANSDEYRDFWSELGQGRFKAGEFQRFGKGGKEIWIQASYNPIFDPNGRPFKVVKYASDITAQKMQSADHEGQLAAISRSQATIEFELDGTIIKANENFLAVVGYTLEEIRGKHHRMFADPEFAESDEYRGFWSELGQGHFKAGEFQRFGKGGKEVWIQASYNPIFDPNGRPYKVVKYASDITDQKEREVAFREQIEAMMARHSAKIDGFSQTLTGSIGEVQDATASLQGAVAEQNRASYEQASAVTEVTSTLSELRQTATLTLEQASTVQETAQRSVEELSRGGAVLSECVDSIGEIRAGVGDIRAKILELSDHTHQIGDIIATVNEIAEQSKLLAFNASIEATRAGEFGKSFAVVANEMRDLAEQSKQATREVRKLLSDITLATEAVVGAAKDGYQRAEAGQALASRASEAIGGLRTVVDASAAASQQIASAVSQQEVGVSQVAEAMISIDSTVRQGAENMEKLAQISGTLGETSGSLGTLVGDLEAMKDETGTGEPKASERLAA